MCPNTWKKPQKVTKSILKWIIFWVFLFAFFFFSVSKLDERIVHLYGLKVWNGSMSFLNLVDNFLENWHFSLCYNIDSEVATSEMVIFNKMNYQNYKLGFTVLKFAYSGLQAVSDKMAFRCSALSCYQLVLFCLIYYSNSILLLFLLSFFSPSIFFKIQNHSIVKI